MITVVAHHIGYGEDWLTRDEDRVNTWFYDPAGKNGTFAPAVMLDRTVSEGETVPVNSIGYFNDFRTCTAEFDQYSGIRHHRCHS